MPTYLYEVIEDDGSGGERFEVVQPMSDPPLTNHPETGQPIRKVFSVVRIAGKWTDAAMTKNANDPKKLAELGFTQYVKGDDGRYEKRAGKGPQTISPD